MCNMFCFQSTHDCLCAIYTTPPDLRPTNGVASSPIVYTEPKSAYGRMWSPIVPTLHMRDWPLALLCLRCAWETRSPRCACVSVRVLASLLLYGVTGKGFRVQEWSKGEARTAFREEGRRITESGTGWNGSFPVNRYSSRLHGFIPKRLSHILITKYRLDRAG